MVLDAIVNPDGMLIATVPKALWGKEVQLTIVEKAFQKETSSLHQDSTVAYDASEDDKSQCLAQWEAISAIFKEADKRDIPHRTIDEILQDIHEFREAE